MKRISIVILAVIVVVTSGCSASQTTHDDNSGINEVISNHGSEKAVENTSPVFTDSGPLPNFAWDPANAPLEIIFLSLEEFVSYIEEPGENADYDLGKFDKYYLPNGLPDNYKLYKITAGIPDVGFWYLPEECLISRETIMEAESLSRHFLFIFTRWGLESPMDGIKVQHGFTDENLVNGKYLLESMPYILFFEADGELMMLYLPTSLPVDADGALDPMGKPFIKEIDLDMIYDFSAEVVYVIR